MGRKTLAIVVLALAIPGVALAAKPSKPSPSQSKAAPTVMYVLKGTLWNYAAASSTTTGPITIHVTHSNYHGRLLKGQDLSFTVAANTTTLNGNTTISDGARGVVKFRTLKNTTGSRLMAALTASTPMTAVQVIDQAH
ncbi:MAG TPA: hypothetical protein VHU60_09635 [Gaiellaceae bacterium]|jgi:hypothetical protein|nr:hypothetical protein [Gaiellaceae bacterium]